MPIGSSFICFLAFWHVTHTEVYSLTPLKFNLGWLNTHVEVYITKEKTALNQSLAVFVFF